MSSKSVRVLAVLALMAIVIALAGGCAEPSPAPPPPPPSGAPSEPPSQPSPTTPEEFDEASPPGTKPRGKIAFVQNGNIHVINADGTGGIDLGIECQKYNYGWSPGGGKILYWYKYGHGYRCVVNADGTGKIELDWGRDFVWSPNGEKISYINDYGNLCVINADGTGKLRLVPEVYAPRWSPEGKRIAFDKGCYAVVQTEFINVDGTGRTELGGYAGRWSPDGRLIAYISRPIHIGDSWRLEVMDLGTTKTTTLVTAEGGTSIYEPSWSPNAENILYQVWGCSRRVGYLGYHVFNIQTSKDIPLGDRGIAGPAWSPYGKRISYGREGCVYIINTDGTGKIRLEGENPQWSPDGKKVAYEYVEKFGEEVLGRYVCTINADGSGEVKLKGQYPQWSPDSEKLAFEFEGNIYVANADGSAESRLCEGVNPSWAPAM